MEIKLMAYEELIEIVESQNKIIEKQNKIIAGLINENAEKENMINVLTNEHFSMA